MQSHLITPMTLGSRRAFTFLQARSHKFGIDVASRHHHANIKICKLCHENLVEKEYHLLTTSSKYAVIR